MEWDNENNESEQKDEQAKKKIRGKSRKESKCTENSPAACLQASSRFDA